MFITLTFNLEKSHARGCGRQITPSTSPSDHLYKKLREPFCSLPLQQAACDGTLLCITIFDLYVPWPTPSKTRFITCKTFRQVLQWLGQRYADLLNPDETQFIRRFDSLPRRPQALLVRMVMRKGVRFVRASWILWKSVAPTPPRSRCCSWGG